MITGVRYLTAIRTASIAVSKHSAAGPRAHYR